VGTVAELRRFEQEPMTRGVYLLYRALLDGAPWYVAQEAVATTGLEHPEWDMDEVRTFAEWEAVR
jgi:hypothetical protein